MKALAAAVVVLLTACTAGIGAEETSTTILVATAPPPETTTTTTTPPAGPIDICGRGTVWEVGATYVARCFIIPLGFTPRTDGWTASGALLEWWTGFWAEPGTTGPALRYATLAFRPDEDPDDILESILTIDGVNPESDVGRSTTAGIDVRSVDVSTEPSLGSWSQAGQDCLVTPQSAIDLYEGNAPGYPLVDFQRLGSPGKLFGLGACWKFRIWVVASDDTAATIIATVNDLNRFDDLIPMMDELVETITVATP